MTSSNNLIGVAQARHELSEAICSKTEKYPSNNDRLFGCCPAEAYLCVYFQYLDSDGKRFILVVSDVTVPRLISNTPAFDFKSRGIVLPVNFSMYKNLHMFGSESLSTFGVKYRIHRNIRFQIKSTQNELSNNHL